MFGALVRHLVFFLIAAAALVAYEHFKIRGESTRSLFSLVAAVGFGLAPLRALVREVLAIEGKVLHSVHGIGALVVLGLTLSGFISGGPLMGQAALAPFALMGAAQAVMHSDHPRNREQAEALRRFVTSLPEVQQVTRSGDLGSPAEVRRAITALSDLVRKAQALGETELRSDPGFQAALRRSMTRIGLSIGLDTVDKAADELAANPAAAAALPQLRQHLAAARKTLEQR